MSSQMHSQQPGIYPASAVHPEHPLPNQPESQADPLILLFQTNAVLYHEIGNSSQEDGAQFPILNQELKRMYTAVRENSIEEKLCCLSQPVWTIHVVDQFQREVLTIRSGVYFNRGAGGVHRKIPQIIVKISPDTVVGYVRLRWILSKIHLDFYKKSHRNHVYNMRGDIKAKDEHGNCEMMVGPLQKIIMRCQIKNHNGDQVAAIARLAPGGMRPDIQMEMMGVKYLPGLDIHDKVLMLGAAFFLKIIWDRS